MTALTAGPLGALLSHATESVAENCFQQPRDVSTATARPMARRSEIERGARAGGQVSPDRDRGAPPAIIFLRPPSLSEAGESAATQEC